MGGDERFLPFFGLKLVKGKGFSPSAPNDAVLVNEAFVKKMAIQEPVNYRFPPTKILLNWFFIPVINFSIRIFVRIKYTETNPHNIPRII